MENTPPSVRLYQPKDRAAVLKIAADTAFFGEPVEVYLSDRRIFQDVMYTYYTDLEPEHLWVACNDRQVVGFLAGGFAEKRRSSAMVRRILPNFLGSLVRRRYQFDRSAFRYGSQLLKSAIRSEVPQVDMDLYPAHLHINLSEASRGLGVGKALMAAYLNQLRQNHIPGVHLFTTSLNKAAIGLYKRFGFELLDARPTQMWDQFVDAPVENQAYGLLLSQPIKE